MPVASECVSGMSSGVSSVAYPNMWPWSPAPISSGLCLRPETAALISTLCAWMLLMNLHVL